MKPEHTMDAAQFTQWLSQEADVKFKCFCETKELRVLEKKNGTMAYRRQCVRCGETSADIAHAKLSEEQKKSARAFDTELSHGWWRKRIDWCEHKKSEYWEAQEEMKKGRKDWYQRYLQSAEWRTIRTKVLQRCNYTCEGCGSFRAEEVHHLTYDHVGEEFLFQLVGLCSSCHRRYHDKANQRAAEAKTFLNGIEPKPMKEAP